MQPAFVDPKPFQKNMKLDRVAGIDTPWRLIDALAMYEAIHSLCHLTLTKLMWPGPLSMPREVWPSWKAIW